MNLKKKNNDIVLEEVWCENGAGSTLPLLKYPLLEQTGIVEHCFTTRIGGVSKGIYESLNLSFTRGDEDAAVRENFRRLAGAMETDVSKFVFTDQTHTTNVRRVTAEDAGKGIVKERDYTDIDGLDHKRTGTCTLDVLCRLRTVILCGSGAPCDWHEPFRLEGNGRKNGSGHDHSDET